jgi:hypothetical protein
VNGALRDVLAMGIASVIVALLVLMSGEGLARTAPSAAAGPTWLWSEASACVPTDYPCRP